MTDNRYGQFTYGGGHYGQRGGKSITRTATATADAAVETTRTGTDKTRTATATADAAVQTTRFFEEAFPDELTRDLSWDFVRDERGFVSEWVHRTPRPGHGSVAAYADGQLRGTPLTLIVEYDRTGDGTPDARSEPQRLRSSTDVAVFSSLSGGEGQYRVILRDIEPQDLLVAINISTTHT